MAVFGLLDLWRALSNVVEVCWLRENHNGRGFPSGPSVWAAFTRGFGTGRGNLNERPTRVARFGNETFNVLDLEDLLTDE